MADKTEGYPQRNSASTQIQRLTGGSGRWRPVDEPVETVDSAALLKRPDSSVRVPCTGQLPLSPCQHGAVDEQEVVQAQVADVPSTFDESVVLLDVREDDEWRRGHAPGARHIPMGEIPTRLAELDPNAMLFVMCHVGGRSQRVAQYLAGHGYTPLNVVGGMQAWADAGRPVVTDSGDAGVA